MHSIHKVIIAVIALSLATGASHIFYTSKNIKSVISSNEKEKAQNTLKNVMTIIDTEFSEMLNEKLDAVVRRRELMNNVSDVVLKAIENIRNMKISEKEAKAQAISFLRNYRYGENQYFFACDKNFKGLAHPYFDMVGSKWNLLMDIKGVKIFPHAKFLLENSVDKNYTVMYWPTASGDKAVRQMALIRYLPDWEWCIGTSVEIESIESDVRRRKQKIREKIIQITEKINESQKELVYVFDSKGGFISPGQDQALCAMDRLSGKPLLDRFKEAVYQPKNEVAFDCGGKGDYAASTAFVDYFKGNDLYVAVSLLNNAYMEPSKQLTEGQYYLIASLAIPFIILIFFVHRALIRPIRELQRHAREVRIDGFEQQSKTIHDEIAYLKNHISFMELQLRRQNSADLEKKQMQISFDQAEQEKYEARKK